MLKTNGVFQATRFLYDDPENTADKVTVIEVYYHKRIGPRKLLHYCRFVQDTVLFASENDENLRGRGWYDHGRYPFVFDVLFPVEGSPCGYGFVDVCRNPQVGIDLMRTAIVRNTVVGATPRYFVRGDGKINEEEFKDLRCELVHVQGNIDETAVRSIPTQYLSGNYVSALNEIIQELRETSGNTATATGSTSAGVTAATAIAALQEASGKGSRDSTMTSYRAYGEVVDLGIELVRQFYTAPRQFRITGENGEMAFTSYSNAGLQPQEQGTLFGMDMGLRLPVFDIKVTAQKRNAYSRLSQNELAKELYGAGMFNPQMAEQALLAIGMMDFEGKDEIMQKIARQGQMFQQLQAAIGIAMALAQQFVPQDLPKIAQQLGIQAPAAPMMSGQAATGQSGATDEEGRPEHGLVTRARERANAASQPGGGAA